MSSFEAALLAHGLLPGVVVADGKWRRCATRGKPKKRNGAYVLRADGRGWFMDWASDSGAIGWNEGKRPAAGEEQAVRRHLRQEERKRRWQAILAAQALWAAAEPMRGLHPYLAGKGLSAAGCQHLRQSAGRLLVPLMRGQRLISVQQIAADGTKRFFAGAPVRGGCCVLERQRAALTCICEGLATGLAIYQAIAHARVVVAFNAGNLPVVARAMKEAGPLRTQTIVCADNDHETQKRTGSNPGLEKAREAAHVLGAALAFPAGIQGTDWADALQEWTLEGSARSGAARVQRLVLGGMRYVG